MWGRLFILGAFVLLTVYAAEPSTRPKNCAVGSSYQKDCNTCTCGSTPKGDKCSAFDCSRAKTSTTPRSSSTARPGVCPTKVTPRPGIDNCKNRNQASTCKLDSDCSLAKKCCANGCEVYSCKNAIYPNTP